MEAAVSIKNVHKSYNGFQALSGVNLQVENEVLFGLIGPDGAGKTTLMRILTTLLFPSKGHAKVLGYDTVKDFKEIRKIAGYMPGRFSLYPDLSVEENLNFYARIFGTTVHQNYHLIRDIYEQIEPFKDRHAGKLSGGMKQKLALSCALIHKPEILFLDEPTFGVDAVSRQEFWDMLIKLRNEGMTIMVSTPYMDEAALCDKIALMQKGGLLDADTPHNIRQKFPQPLYAVKADSMGAVLGDLRKLPEIQTAFPFGDNIHITTFDELDKRSMEKALSRKGYQNVEVLDIEPDIEDCFMNLIHTSDD
ncbi:MAG: ABC transporter ATP-binding protein [Bacteroidota bacterium]